MTDHPYPGTDTVHDTGSGADRESPPGTPRWRSMVGIVIAIALLLLVVALHLTRTIGPGLH